MKKLILGLAAVAATVTAVVAVPAAANAQPYRHGGYHRGYYHHHPVRVCSFRHHHRVCYFR